MQYLSFIVSVTAAHVLLALSLNNDVPFSAHSARKAESSQHHLPVNWITNKKI